MAYLLDDDKIIHDPLPNTHRHGSVDGIRFTLKGQEILSLSRFEVECLWFEAQSESELLDSLIFHRALVEALEAELAERRAGSK